tara:strand:- start:153 stop:656 length:504 start_codon:yes stop_codon:yes gene_type:complete
MKKLAEVKPFKVGEPLTDNADGNTEPSILDSSSKACVETRRKVCIKCGNEIPQTKYKSSKFCSIRCRNAFTSWKWRVKKGLIKKPGVGSGNNQEKNIKNVKARAACRKAMKLLPKVCNRCSSKNNLLAHHIDHNRQNNSLDNFEILCKKCHQNHHTIKDNTGKYIKV